MYKMDTVSTVKNKNEGQHDVLGIITDYPDCFLLSSKYPHTFQ